MTKSRIFWLLVSVLLACGFFFAYGPSTRTTLDELLQDYHAYGLPLPEGVKPVEFQADLGTLIGFPLERSAKNNSASFLVGLKERHGLVANAVELKPEFLTAGHFQACARDLAFVPPLFGTNMPLALAIQCHARGWAKLSRELLRWAEKNGDNRPLRMQLIEMAWEYWRWELTRPDTDRTPIARHMRSALTMFPEEKTQWKRALVEDLEASLVPSSAAAGSIESLIDALVDLSSRRPGEDSYGWSYDREDPRYERLVMEGFCVVPALIDHLDDKRLTRSLSEAFINFRPWNLRVRDVVGDVLEGLAGGPLDGNSLRRLQGYSLAKEKAVAWWQVARNLGEEKYLVTHVFPPDDTEAKWPNQQALRLLAAKYPHHLPEVYRTLLDKRPNLQSWPVAQAIAKSSLSREIKVSLFRYGAASNNLYHSDIARRELQNLVD